LHSVKSATIWQPSFIEKIIWQDFSFRDPSCSSCSCVYPVAGDLQILLIFALLIVVFSFYRFDPRIPIGYAILLFVIQAVLTAQNQDVTVKLLAVLSYWLLVVGIICMIIELFRKKGAVQTVA
jgi:hypothetical protein